MTELTTSPVDGRLVDKVYSAYIVAWYTMFAIQGVDQIADRSLINISTPDEKFNFHSMSLQHYSEEVEPTVVKLAMISCCSTFLKESFRMTQEHCIKNNLEEVLFAAPWYRFAKILVNCLSHDMMFSFDRLNPKHLPAEYKGVKITKDLEGSFLPVDFTAQLFLDLGTDIGLFVAEKITGLEDGTKPG